MNEEMSNTNGKNVIWEEKNSIELTTKSVNNGESAVCDTITVIKELKGNEHLNGTTGISGIYKIINKVNGKYYVGSSDNISRRWYNHKIELKHNKHNNSHLQRAWNKYKESNFDFMLIETIPAEKLLLIEQKYLDICKKYPNTAYNISYNALAPMKGKTHTEESKMKIINANLGRKRTLESKIKQSNNMKGKYIGVNNPMYGTHRKGKDAPSYGKYHTEESNEKNRISHLNLYNGNKNPMYGKHHTEETKEKIKNKLRDPTIYKFKNIKTNELFSGTRYEFEILFNVRRNYIHDLIHNVKPRKIWTLVS